MIAVLLLALQTNSLSQAGIDSTGLPGDNLSLQGVLQLFKQSASPEEFEKQLNTESSHVNNLDLNGDGEVDYIRVIDMTENDVHAFVLQVPVAENENQDVAVIELEKTGEATAVIQIIGDEEIYGEQIIVEPTEEEKTGGSKGGQVYLKNTLNADAIVVNVWVWPSVRYVYAPAYRPWVSPWRWRHYPVFWRPWRPFTWHVWHPYYRHYHHSFGVVHVHRVTRAHHIYTPHRTASVTVRTRNSNAIGNYKVKRTTATVKGPRGNTTQVRKTTVRGPRGNVKASRTTVRRKH
jgi:hypothetical protein